jgi:hypothetical protein
MRIAASMGGVLWLGGGALAALMLTFAPPTRAIGVLGWLVAAGIVALAVVIGVLRLRRPPPSDFGTLFAGSVIALLGIALLEWLAGGRVSPYHQLYALPVVYAAAVHPRRRALLVLALVCLVVWAPVIYAPADARLPADTAGQLLLLLVLAVAARIVFALVRAQRAGLRDARQRADDIARRDPLTGLGNRLSLEETLEVEVARASSGNLAQSHHRRPRRVQGDQRRLRPRRRRRVPSPRRARHRRGLAHRGPVLPLGGRRVRSRASGHDRGPCRRGAQAHLRGCERRVPVARRRRGADDVRHGGARRRRHRWRRCSPRPTPCCSSSRAVPTAGTPAGPSHRRQSGPTDQRRRTVAGGAQWSAPTPPADLEPLAWLLTRR